MQNGRANSGAMSLDDIFDYLGSAEEVPPELVGAWDGPYAQAARAAGAGINADSVLAAAVAPQQGAPVQTPPRQAARPSEPPIHDFQEAFLSQLEPEANRVAKQYNFNKNYLLGLAAHESTWFQNRDALTKNNPLGINLPGTNRLRTFRSLPDAFDYWGSLWGPAVSGATTPNDFISKMQGRSIGKYNSADPGYNSKLEGTVNSAIMRDRQWEQMGRPTGKAP